MAAEIRHHDKTGVTQITGKTWSDAFAGVAQTAEKFAVQNIGTRDLTGLLLKIKQVGSNDGDDMARTGADSAGAGLRTTVPPYEMDTPTLGGTGGVWAANEGTGVYGYVVTVVVGGKESGPSLEKTINVNDADKKVTLGWTKPAVGATYKVYRTKTPGTYGASSLRATLGDVDTYEDDGDAVGAGQPPADNRTGGDPPNYGTVPPVGTADINIGTLKIGQQFIFWVNWVIPSSTPEAGNPRQFELQFVES